MAQANGDTAASLEIRDYCGDFDDLVELTQRVWIQEYGGKTWVPIPDPAFLRWRLRPQSGAFCLAAYAGAKLVGSVSSFPQSLRIGSSVHEAHFSLGFTVDPDGRGVGLSLIEQLRRENDERGIAFGLGMVLDEPGSNSYRFWTGYQKAFPQKFRILFRGGFWSKLLAPRAARASIKTWERVVGSALGPLLGASPYRYDPHVRPYRDGDLQRCAQMLDKASARFDWAQVWTPEQLSSRLENLATRTLVFERDGCVRGMVNYHYLSMQGRELVRAALIGLWADDGLTGMERIRLLSHICTDLRDRGVQMVAAVRCATMPAAAFVANLFFPAPQRFLIGVHLTARTGQLMAPRTWSFEIT